MAVHPSVAAGLLAWAAATDNREVTEAAAIAWADALDANVTLADGKAAISAHRAESSDWLMPAHINTRVRAMRRDRLMRAPSPQPPESLDGDPAREQAWLYEWNRAIGDGATEHEAMFRACDFVETEIPQPVTAPAPRPLELDKITRGRQCEHGCMEKPVRAAEGAK
jgi:hypothetical protein